MRIKLNNLGTGPVNYGVDDIKPDRSFDTIKHNYCFYVAFYCKRCGAELYGHWTGHAIHYQSIHINSWSKDDFSRLEKAHEQSVQDLNAIKKEADEIINSPKCSCCGEYLSDDRGYFAVYEHGACLIPSKPYSWSYRAPKYDYAEEYNDRYYKWEDWKKNRYASRVELAEIFDKMRSVRESDQRLDAWAAVDRLVSKYESSSPAALVPSLPNIKDQPEQLKEYLFKLIQTETNILLLRKRLEKLYALRINADTDAYGSTLSPLMKAKALEKERKSELDQCQKELELVNSQTLAPIVLPMPNRPEKPAEPQYDQPGFFNKKRILAFNAARKEIYEADLHQYEKAMEQYTQALEARNQEIALLTKQQEDQHQREIEEVQRKAKEAKEKWITAKQKRQNISASLSNMATPEKAKKMLLDQEIRQAEDLLQKAICCKHQLYNLNIIFGKYRDITAISTFYEYLMSGRCASLEGADGAYNLYESELRANIIIGQLDSVIKSLEKIKDNQYMIYSSIQNVNTSLRRLEDSMSTMSKSLKRIDAKTQTMTDYMKKVAENSDVIAHNTAVTAHYTKINAELTNALGYMVALK